MSLIDNFTLIHQPKQSLFFRGLLILLWARFPVWEYVFSVMKRVPFFASSPETGLVVLIITLAFLSLTYLVRRLSVMDVMVYIFIVMFYKFQYVLFPQNTAALQLNEVTFLYCVLPYMFFGRALNIKTILNDFRLTSIISIFLMFFAYFIQGGLQVTFEEQKISEYMSGAYFILPHLLLITWLAIDYRNKVDIAFAIIGALVLIAMGNRGSVLLFFLFIAYMFMFMGETRTWVKKYRYWIIFIGVVGYSYIANFLVAILSPFVPSLRVLEALSNYDFFLSVGRDEIRGKILTAIFNSPLEIRGMTAEWLICGGYSHNIIFDFCVSFGLFFGLLLIFALCVLFYRAYQSCFNREDKIFFMILLVMGMGQLQISGTYLSNTYLFCSIGYAVSLIIVRHNYRTQVHHQQLRQSIKPHGKAET